MRGARAAVQWWRGTLPGRTWARQAEARGGLLAAGMAFIGFFALFPVLVVVFTVFGRVVGGRADLQRQVAAQIDAWLGVRLVGTAPGDGLVQVSDLVAPHSLTVAGVVGPVLLVASGMRWLDATREGIRAVAGLPPLPVTARALVRDLFAVTALGGAVLATGVSGVGVGAAAGVLLSRLGLGQTRVGGTAVTVLTALVLTVTDAAILWVLLRLLAQVRAPLADLAPGLLLGGLALQALKLSGGLLLRQVGGNPLLAGASVLAVVLVWLNLAARGTLLVAALGVTRAERRGHWPAVPDGPGAPVDGGAAGEARSRGTA